MREFERQSKDGGKWNKVEGAEEDGGRECCGFKATDFPRLRSEAAP